MLYNAVNTLLIHSKDMRFKTEKNHIAVQRDNLRLLANLIV